MDLITREEFFARRAKPEKKKPAKAKAPHPHPGPPYGGWWLRFNGRDEPPLWCETGIGARRAVRDRFKVRARDVSTHHGAVTGTSYRVGGRVVATAKRGQADPAKKRTKAGGANVHRIGEDSAPIFGTRNGAWWTFEIPKTLRPVRKPRRNGESAKMAKARGGISVGPDGTVIWSVDKGGTMRAASVEEALARMTGYRVKAIVGDEGRAGRPCMYLVWRYDLVAGRRVRVAPEPDGQIDLLSVPL